MANPIRFELQIQSTLRDDIDRWRIRHIPPPSRSKAARRLLGAGLATGKQAARADGPIDSAALAIPPSADMPPMPDARDKTPTQLNVRISAGLSALLGWYSGVRKMKKQQAVEDLLREVIGQHAQRMGQTPER